MYSMFGCLFFFDLLILITLWCLQTLLAVNYDSVNFEVPRFTFGFCVGLLLKIRWFYPNQQFTMFLFTDEDCYFCLINGRYVDAC
jgi:hypothetical protein